jgi:hypothetical protein
VQTRLLSGSIQSSDLADLLLWLQASSKSGLLRLQSDGVTRDLYLSAGHLVFADSSAREDSLDWLLFSTGALTEERHAEVRALMDGGLRPGRALVETGALSPAMLCEWTDRRARWLAGDVLLWKAGSYGFEEGTPAPAGAICVKISPAEILLSGLRSGPMASTLTASLPQADAVLEAALSVMPGLLAKDHLKPHEAYVLSLVDGRRKVSEICFLSEIGEMETLTILALLGQSGCLRSVGVAVAVGAGAGPSSPGEPGTLRQAPERGVSSTELPLPVDLPAGDTTAEMRAVIRIYNDLYAHVYAHLIKEVGPIAEQLIEKHLREVRDLHAALFNRTAAAREGCLPEDTLMRNVNLIKDQNRRELLVAGMHDYLMAMVLAVRRILGPAHEGQVVRRLRELRCSRT